MNGYQTGIFLAMLGGLSCQLLVIQPVDPSSPVGFLSFAALSPAAGSATAASAADESAGSGGQGGPPLFTVGGTIYGLTGTGLTLSMSGSVAQNLSVGAGSSSYTFSTGLEDGQNYNISVLNQPGGQVGCAFANSSGTISSSNVTSIHLFCTPPPAPQSTGPALYQNVNVDGQGDVAMVTAGALFNISLDYAIQGSGCGTCIRPAFIGIAGPAPQADQMACIENHNPPSTYHTWVSPDPVFYKPFNDTLRAPATPGVYLIRGRSGLTFCSILEGNFTNQGATIAVIAVQ
ncbi:MAG: hypothetical protein HS115_15500 [Spirochaetales bacterium]|nr:hypothetical protein [Spirochaetales bacterium]